MGLFSTRYIREHFLKRDPDVDSEIRRPGHPVNGDVMVYSDEYGRGVYSTPPIDPTIADVISDGDILWWDAADAQLEAVTPTLAPDEAGAADNEMLLWDTGTSAWVASGLIYYPPAYGTISVLDGAVTQAVTATPGKLTAFDTNGPSGLTTVDHTDDSVTVTEAGDYKVSFNASFSYAAAAVIQFHVRVDAVEGALGGRVEVLNVGDVVNVSFSGHMPLSAAEVVTVYVEADADANITVIDAQLSVERASG